MPTAAECALRVRWDTLECAPLWALRTSNVIICMQAKNAEDFRVDISGTGLGLLPAPTTQIPLKFTLDREPDEMRFIVAEVDGRKVRRLHCSSNKIDKI